MSTHAGSGDLISFRHRKSLANRNWLLGKCCTTSAHSPTQANISPSPVCEHVRDCDTRRRHNDASNTKNLNQNQHKISSSSAATQQIILNTNDLDLDDDKYPVTSHLARLRDPKQQKTSTTVPPCSKGMKQTKFLMNASGGCGGGFSGSCNANGNGDILNNKVLLDMGSKLNLGVHKLIKLEEIYVREKLQRDEWKRKARVCDAICCLLVFFLLVICTVFIFIILPTVKTASLID